MTRFHLRSATAVMLAVLIAGITIPSSQAPAEESCGEYGTTVEFADSPAEAARQALKEEKLVFVLHVSGNFETPEYT